MSRDRPWPKYHVCRLSDTGEWEYATEPNGEPIWRHGSNPELVKEFITRDCIEAAERDPEGTYIVIDPDRSELYRAEPVTCEAPF